MEDRIVIKTVRSKENKIIYGNRNFIGKQFYFDITFIRMENSAILFLKVKSKLRLFCIRF